MVVAGRFGGRHGSMLSGSRQHCMCCYRHQQAGPGKQAPHELVQGEAGLLVKLVCLCMGGFAREEQTVRLTGGRCEV